MSLPTKQHSFFYYLFSGLLASFLLTFLLRFTLVFLGHDVFHSLTWEQKFYALFWGWHFDLAFVVVPITFIGLVCYVLVRAFKIQHLYWWPFSLVMVFITLAQTADNIYFLEAGRHASYEVWDTLYDAKGLFGNVIHGHLWLAIGATLLAILILGLSWGKKVAIKRTVPGLEIPLLIIIATCVYGLRGSFTQNPMKPMRVFRLSNEAQSSIAENGLYTMLYTLYDGKQLNAIYQQFPRLPASVFTYTLKKHFINTDQTFVAPGKKYNVILFALEAWPSYFMNDKRQGQLVTPNFDRIARHNFSTDGLMAEGHRTVEGLFSMECSYPNPLGEALLHNKLNTMHYHCLPRILKDNGWYTAIFQGMHTGTPGSLSQKLGVTDSFGKLDIKITHYPKTSWGDDDNDIYDFMLRHAVKDEKQQPFFYIVNTMTTHDGVLPPSIPYIFGGDSRIDKLESTLHYADKALARFIRKLKKSLTRPTLLVITADHTRGPIPGFFNNYHTPFAMMVINGPSPQKHVPYLASQRDIAPTILDWLGGYAPWFTGQSLWGLPGKDYRASYYNNGKYGWVESKHIIQFSLDNPEDINCFLWDTKARQPQPANCPPETKQREIRARAYMHYSQDLLFHGKTSVYGSPASLKAH